MKDTTIKKEVVKSPPVITPEQKEKAFKWLVKINKEEVDKHRNVG